MRDNWSIICINTGYYKLLFTKGKNPVTIGSMSTAEEEELFLFLLPHYHYYFCLEYIPSEFIDWLFLRRTSRLCQQFRLESLLDFGIIQVIMLPIFLPLWLLSPLHSFQFTQLDSCFLQPPGLYALYKQQ